jgi:hypothetical protein
VIVAFNGGKDCIVILHLAFAHLKVGPFCVLKNLLKKALAYSLKAYAVFSLAKSSHENCITAILILTLSATVIGTVRPIYTLTLNHL